MSSSRISIRAHLAQLFPGQTILESAVIRLARDAELELDDEGGRTHLEVVEREVRRRRRSDVIRLELESSASPELQALLRDRLELERSDMYLVRGPLDLRGLMPLCDIAGHGPTALSAAAAGWTCSAES